MLTLEKVAHSSAEATLILLVSSFLVLVVHLNLHGPKVYDFGILAEQSTCNMDPLILARFRQYSRALVADKTLLVAKGMSL